MALVLSCSIIRDNREQVLQCLFILPKANSGNVLCLELMK